MSVRYSFIVEHIEQSPGDRRAVFVGSHVCAVTSPVVAHFETSTSEMPRDSRLVPRHRSVARSCGSAYTQDCMAMSAQCKDGTHQPSIDY